MAAKFKQGDKVEMVRWDATGASATGDVGKVTRAPRGNLVSVMWETGRHAGLQSAVGERILRHVSAPPAPPKRTVWIKLDVTGRDAAAAFDAVDVLLDVGTLQELIVEAAADVGHVFEITSATSEGE